MTNTRRIQATELRLTFADKDFIWAGESCEGLPILRWLDGSICEPAVMYFGYLARTKRLKISSMKPAAYDLRHFLTYLANAEMPWSDTKDLTLSGWRKLLRGLLALGKISKAQIEKKIHNVFEFYHLLPRAMRFDEALAPTPVFVGPENPLGGTRFPITSKVKISPRSGELKLWVGAEHASGRRLRRPTPNSDDVAKILSHLRSRPDVKGTRRKNKSAQRMLELRAEATWLMGRCMAAAGLRASEVGSLSMVELLHALRREGILTGRQVASDVLDELSGDEPRRAAVLAALEKLQAGGRTRLYVQITGKGDKARHAPFPTGLVRDLLEIGVWTIRREQLQLWSGPHPRNTPLGIFLSPKTRRAYRAGSIADIMKDAFNAVGVGGSGHRLRAHFAISYAQELLEETLLAHGYVFSQAVENTVLDRLAEALGHSNVNTTLKHYVDMALMKHFRLSNTKQLAALRTLFTTVAERRAVLSIQQLKLITDMARAFAVAGEQSILHELIRQAIDNPDLNPAKQPSAEAEATARPPLTVVK